jgi:hypothetical protein
MSFSLKRIISLAHLELFNVHALSVQDYISCLWHNFVGLISFKIERLLSRWEFCCPRLRTANKMSEKDFIVSVHDNQSCCLKYDFVGCCKLPLLAEVTVVLQGTLVTL